MNQVKLEKFVDYLHKEKWLIFGPVQKTEKNRQEASPFLTAHGKHTPEHPVIVEPINKNSKIVLDDRIPTYSFKRFFIPECEELFRYKNNSFSKSNSSAKIALFGMGILDLKAVNLYDLVYAKDPYYQARRRNILIIGHSFAPEKGPANLFGKEFEEDVLKHLQFDIFFCHKKENPKEYKVFTGSIKGQRILEHFGYDDFEHIQFSGAVKEGKSEEKMLVLRDKLKNKHNAKLWEELGKKCIECGKCTIACPTCFCFRIDDNPNLGENNGSRQRCWDSCFYREFSEVAGGHKFLNSTAERIHFWYFHKFARIPDEFGFMGCVGCKRCAKACPVGIDIEKVLKEIENS